jgi:hypothetical protein
MLIAAEQAGMSCKVGGRRPVHVGRTPHKPFFDTECFTLKRQVRLLGRQGRASPEYKTLESTKYKNFQNHPTLSTCPPPHTLCVRA